MQISRPTRSMRSQLMLWFAIVAVVPLLFFGMLIYRQEVQSIKDQTMAKLKAVRDLKAQHINDWKDEIENDLGSISANTRAMLLPEEKATLQTDPATIKKVRGYMANFIRFHTSYVSLYAIDPATGHILVSTSPQNEGEDCSSTAIYADTLKTKRLSTWDVHRSPLTGLRLITFAAPVFLPGNAGSLAVIVVADIRTEPLDKLLMERIGMGQSGETLLVNRDMVVLTPLRWLENAPLRDKLTATPALLAASGKTGIIETTDYRGAPVLSAYTYISSTGWGLVAKEDLAELYSPATLLAKTLGVLLVVCLGGVVVVAVILSGRISQPLLSLHATVDAIRKGDLSARNQITRNDEVGFLAKAFNLMADQIQQELTVKQSNREIMEAITNCSNISNFCTELLQVLMRSTHSQLGVFYLPTPNGKMEPAAAEGVSLAALEPFDATQYEGALGEALRSHKICHISEIPFDTRFSFRTVAGTVTPRAMLTIPLLERGKTIGVIALASLHDYSSSARATLETSFTGMSVGFAHLLAGEVTRRMAKELSTKNTELQAQAAELEAQTAELQKQSQTLTSQNTELEVQSARVTEASRLKSEFLSNMSHELRTPLNSVLALSRVLQMQAKERLTSEECNYIEIIERNGKHLLSLINDILDLAKIESGRTEVSCEELSLSDKISTIAENLEPLFRDKKIALSVNIDEGLPHIWTDERRVHQILQNIIGNAVKFTMQGQISIQAHRSDRDIEIIVTDTGIGIPEKELPHIFDEFRQVDGGSARSFEGSGLGLAIAAKSARLLGGRITVQSRLGAGSIFTITLPLTAASLDSGSVVEPQSDHAAELQLVLVIDDDPNDAFHLANQLSAEGFAPKIAASGKEALRMIETSRPRLILLDVLMPEQDGWEVLQSLKTNPYHADIPVIIVSVAKDRTTGLALGAAGVLAKPVERTKLLSAIHKALAQKTGQSPPLGQEKSRILLVEDSEPAILQIKMVLESAGYRVDVARGGQEAIDLMGNPPPDGIILDLMMPQIDGFEVLERLRGTPATAHTPVIILTAKNLTTQDLGRLSANNVRQLIQKGDVNREELLDQVKRLLGHAPKGAGSPPKTTQKLPVSARVRPPSDRFPIILAIEDNPDNMTSLRAILKDRCLLREASDGELGLSSASQDCPDLILLDLSLPKIDGFEVARRLRASTITCNIPIIALTARAMQGDREKALEAGCDDYLSKPIEEKLLSTALSQWLGAPGGVQ